MSMKKGMLLVFIAGALITGVFAGGAGQKSTPAPVAPGNVQTGQAGPVTYPVPGRPKITIARTVDTDLVPGGFTSYNDTPGMKELMRQTGIDAEFIELVDNNAFLVYLAGGNLPDVIYGTKAFYPGGEVKMHTDGLAQNLTALLPQYAPDYWKFINSDDVYYKDIREPDGQYYYFAGYFRVPESLNASWIGLITRQEFLDKLKMAPPETADELYQYLLRCKNELGIKTPFMSNKGRFDTIFTGGSLTSPFGLPKTDTYQINGKVHFGAYEPQYKDVLAYFNKLYREGLLDNNFAVTDEPTTFASVLGGNTALLFDAVSRIQVLVASANSAPDFNLTALPSMSRVKGERPMYSYADDPFTQGQCAFLPETCRDPVNVLKFFNYAFTEKGNTLVNFGIEGTTYNNINGRPVFTDFVLNNPNGYTLDGILRSYAILNWPILQDEWMTRQRFPLKSQVDAMEKWSNSDISKYRIINNSILENYIDEYAALVTDINTFITESRAQFISGALPIDRFETYYIPALKQMGMDRLLEILQLSYDAYNK